MVCFVLLLLSICAYLFKTGFLSAIIILFAFLVSGFSALTFLKRRQFLSFLFVGAYLAMYFPNPFLVSLGVFPLELDSVELYALTNSMLIFGLMLFFLGTNITKFKVAYPDRIKIYLNRSSIIFVLNMLFLLAGFAIVLAIVFGGGLASLQTTRAELAAGGYSFTGLVRVASLYLFFPFLLAGPMLITQLSKPLQTIPWVITAVLLTCHFFLFRARTPLITVLVSVAIGTLIKNRLLFVYGQSSSKVFKTFRDYIFVIILLVCVFVGGVTITFLRGAIGVGGIRLSHGYLNVWVEQTFDGGDLGYQKIQRAAFALYPNPNPFLMGQSYYRVFLVPMPRFVMPNKPENTSRVFCSAVNHKMYMTGGTIPPGVVGDLYINFGYLGIIGMFIYGLIFGRERYSYLWQWLVLGSSMSWLFHFVRGELSNALVTMLVFLIVSLIFEHILSPDYEIETNELLKEDLSESEY